MSLDRLVRFAARVLAGIFLVGITAHVHAEDKVRVQLRWQHQFQFAGYYVALDRGYYREAGLDVTLIEAGPNLTPVEEVVSGRAEYGVGTSELVLARAQKKPVVVLAPIFQHSPLILVSLRENGIESVHHLVGKRIAMEAEAADLTAYLRQEGIGLDAVKLVPHAQDVGALLRHEVDAMSAYLTDEPFAIASESEKELREFSPRAGGIDFYGDTLFTSETELARHPERVRAFVDATLRGFREAVREPNAAIELVLARTQRHTPAHLRFEAERTVQLIAADIVEVGYTNPGRWEYIASVYASLGLMPANLALDGFLYRTDPERSLPAWLLYGLLGAGLFGAVITTGWLRAFRLARALGEERTRWQAFMEASPLPTLILGEGMHVRYQNSRARALFGRGDELREALSRPELMALLLRARAGEALHDVDLSLNVAGQERFLSLSAAACGGEAEHALLLCLADVSGRKAVEDTLRKEAETDPLTGAFNRRRTLGFLDAARAAAASEGLPLSVGVLDVDRFKAVNDNHGHALGDRVLERLSLVVRGMLRRDDVLGRLGGDEFVIVLPGADRQAAFQVAERVRARVQQELRTVDRQPIAATISVGLATLEPNEEVEHLLARADTALYRAKAEGRDRVSAYGRPSIIAPTAAEDDQHGGNPERQERA